MPCPLEARHVSFRGSFRSTARITFTMTGSVIFCPFMYGAAGGGVTGRFHGNPVTVRAIRPRKHLAGVSRPQAALIAALSSSREHTRTGHTLLFHARWFSVWPSPVTYALWA